MLITSLDKSGKLYPEEDDSEEKADADWKLIMPGRKAVRSYIEDAAILNFRYAAECMQSTKEE